MKPKSILLFILAVAAAVGGFLTFRPLMGMVVAVGFALLGIRYAQEVPSPRAQGIGILGWTLVVAGSVLGTFIPV